MHYTDLTWSGNTIKQQPSWIMYMNIVDIYLRFDRSCTINGLKPRRGLGYPKYDIVRMCVLNIPLFLRPQVYDKPPFLKKKVRELRDF